MVALNINSALNFVDDKVFDANFKKAFNCFDTLMNADGEGKEFLGWIALPSKTDSTLIERCENLHKKWMYLGVDTVVCIGIGGSYLGAECIIKALSNPYTKVHNSKNPEILFSGNNLSEDYLFDLLEYLKGKNTAVIVISKSGTTTEPAVAFRILKERLEKYYGKKGVAERIVAITDAHKGALKSMSDKEGYEEFVIPDDVGGRYSVLTPVGLVPIAVAGYDIRALLAGAVSMQKHCAIKDKSNMALRYAAIRNALYESGKYVEILADFNPRLRFFGEWWKQLFGESEGKEGKGIFPASVSFTTDLHSLGKYIQQGERILIETVLHVKKSQHSVIVNKEEDNSDGLNFLAGKSMGEINKMAMIATRLAHTDGGVPNIVVEIEKIDAFNLGELFYLFEFACGVSGYILGVNPFDQPGVEDYKKNMFALLRKPGYEKESDAILKRV